MENQIMIKHKNDDNISKIQDIIDCLDSFIDIYDEMRCSCCLHPKQIDVLDELNNLEHNNGIKIIKNKISKRCMELSIVISKEQLVPFLLVVEKYAINISILINNIQLFLNDNDGDFIIIKSKTISNSRAKGK